MEIQHLKYFYEVAKKGSFSLAAKSMRVSQPSISKMVKQLEKNEGYVFLDRGKNGVKLTPMGRILFQRCERIFGEFENLRSDLENRKKECQGELWFGASDNILNYLLPDLIKNFQVKNPGVQTKLFAGTSSQILQQMKDFYLELALFYTIPKDDAISFEKIVDVEFVVVSAKKMTVASLGADIFVGSRIQDYKSNYPALKILKNLGVEPSRIIECNSQEVQKRLVLAGTGYSVLPAHMVENEIKNGNLYLVPIKKRVFGPIYLVFRKNRALSQAAMAWAEFLKKEML